MKLCFKFLSLILFTTGVCGACKEKTNVDDIKLYANALGLYSNGEFSKTAELLSGVNKFLPALTLRAKAEYFSGGLNQAEKSCRRVLKYQPANFEVKLYLARIFREMGQSEKVKELVDGMMADNPNDLRLLRFAAVFAEEQGNMVQAAMLLDKAAELSADSAMVLLDRARLRWIAGKGTDALEDLSRAKAMLPTGVPVFRSIYQLEKTIKEVLQ